MDFSHEESCDIFDDETVTLQKNDYLAISLQTSTMEQKVPTSLWDEGMNMNFPNRLDNPFSRATYVPTPTQNHEKSVANTLNISLSPTGLPNLDRDESGGEPPSGTIYPPQTYTQRPVTPQYHGHGDGLSTPFKRESWDLTEGSEEQEPWRIRSNFHTSFNQSLSSHTRREGVLTPTSRDRYSISSSLSSTDSGPDSLTPPASHNEEQLVQRNREPWRSPTRRTEYSWRTQSRIPQTTFDLEDDAEMIESDTPSKASRKYNRSRQLQMKAKRPKREPPSADSNDTPITFTSRGQFVCDAKLKGEGHKTCDRVFQRSEHLTRHKRTEMHTDLRPYACEKCRDKGDPKAFNRRDNYKQHVVKTHLIHTDRGRRAKVDDDEAIRLGWGEFLPARDKELAKDRKRHESGMFDVKVKSECNENPVARAASTRANAGDRRGRKYVVRTKRRA